MYFVKFNMHDFCICANSATEGKGIGGVPQTFLHKRLSLGMFTCISSEQEPLTYVLRNRKLQAVSRL